MTLVVEDGTGLSNANSYAAVATFQTHHSDRGTNVESYSIYQVEQALVQATDYVEKRFGLRFRGVKRSKEQSLQWPRYDAVDNSDLWFDTVPPQLVKAVCEYALLALILPGGLLPVPTTPFPFLDSSGNVVSQDSGLASSRTITVGPITKRVSFYRREGSASGAGSAVSPSEYLPAYPVADEWLRELLKSGFSTTLERA